MDYEIAAISFAKINLGLKIFGLRPDGFHEIEGIFQTVSLRDKIYIKRASLSVESTVQIPLEQNTVFKVWKIFREKYKIPECSIFILKRIPIGAGLGGGSSNAAAVIEAFDRMFSLSLEFEEKLDIACQVGSDVPFFLYGGRAKVKGRGEVVEPLKFVKERYFLIVPPFSISTKWAYNQFDAELNKSIMKSGSLKMWENDFEGVVFRHFPVLWEVKRKLMESGLKKVVLSGSGSCLVAETEGELPPLPKGFKVFSVFAVEKGFELFPRVEKV